jgi:AcrR family transcriptional regulator
MARDTLTLEQIVDAAVELLDAEGLEGLNMRALGKRPGSAPTAVYWHVGSKDNAATPENTFELGLQAILDGLEAQLPARRT